MDYQESEKLRKAWGGKPCNHEHVEKETHKDPDGFDVWDHSDYVCTTCGETFTKEELEKMGKTTLGFKTMNDEKPTIPCEIRNLIKESLIGQTLNHGGAPVTVTRVDSVDVIDEDKIHSGKQNVDLRARVSCEYEAGEGTSSCSFNIEGTLEVAISADYSNFKVTNIMKM